MLFPLLAAAAVAVAPSSPRPIDLRSWFSDRDYPVEALRKGTQGSTRFEVDVGADGLPTGCRITASSGSPVLDEATCAVVRSKARFRPATGKDGKPVPGRYRNFAVWRIPQPTGPFQPAAFHVALLLDFSEDAVHPTCRVIASSSVRSGPSCTEMVKEAAAFGTGAIKLAYLVATAPGDEIPYRGEREWGTRVSYAASDQFYLKSPYPIACRSVATEGGAAGSDPCKGFEGSASRDAPIPKEATKMRTEVSLFIVRREAFAATASCDGGESAAEAQSCN